MIGIVISSVSFDEKFLIIFLILQLPFQMQLTIPGKINILNPKNGGLVQMIFLFHLYTGDFLGSNMFILRGR